MGERGKSPSTHKRIFPLRGISRGGMRKNLKGKKKNCLSAMGLLLFQRCSSGRVRGLLRLLRGITWPKNESAWREENLRLNLTKNAFLSSIALRGTKKNPHLGLRRASGTRTFTDKGGNQKDHRGSQMALPPYYQKKKRNGVQEACHHETFGSHTPIRQGTQIKTRSSIMGGGTTAKGLFRTFKKIQSCSDRCAACKLKKGDHRKKNTTKRRLKGVRSHIGGFQGQARRKNGAKEGVVQKGRSRGEARSDCGGWIPKTIPSEETRRFTTSYHQMAVQPKMESGTSREIEV